MPTKKIGELKFQVFLFQVSKNEILQQNVSSFAQFFFTFLANFCFRDSFFSVARSNEIRFRRKDFSELLRVNGICWDVSGDVMIMFLFEQTNRVLEKYIG